MNNVYEAPKSDVDQNSDLNNSGQGEDFFPEGVKGFSWGALLLNWVWAAFNKSYIGLLALFPYIGIIMVFYLGFKGREMAWRNKRWESVEHFNRVQRLWSIWGIVLTLGPVLVMLIVLTMADSDMPVI